MSLIRPVGDEGKRHEMEVIDFSALPGLVEDTYAGRKFDWGTGIQFAYLLQKSLTGNVNVPLLARHFGVSLTGLDMPRKEPLHVSSLYRYPNLSQRGLLKVHTFCFGLDRTSQDIKSGLVNDHWIYKQGPEQDYDAMKSIGFDASKASPTAWTKFDLLNPKVRGLACVHLRQAQNSVIVKSSIEQVRTEIEEKIETLPQGSRREKDRVRMWERKLALANQGRDHFPNLFWHSHRDMLFPLLGLALAEMTGAPLVIDLAGPKDRVVRQNHAFRQLARQNNRGIKVIDSLDELNIDKGM